MNIARVVGTVVATAKSERLTGHKLLLVRPVAPDGELDGAAYVALDSVGAGDGEVVLVAQGSAARTELEANPPVDATIIAIVDRVDVDGDATYRSS